jgi:hypothetical protein
MKYFRRKWQSQELKTLARAYYVTFNNVHGQQVLQHLLDTVYFSVYEGKDPHEAALHNARRCVVNEILVNIDIGENPAKYEIKEMEIENAS